jgi:hypothetical protein
MSYEPGTSIDLTYLNRNVAVAEEVEHKPSGKQTLCEVGTSFIFEVIDKEIKAWRRVPVLFA